MLLSRVIAYDANGTLCCVFATVIDENVRPFHSRSRVIALAWGLRRERRLRVSAKFSTKRNGTVEPPTRRNVYAMDYP
jgi:hypothetical protein